QHQEHELARREIHLGARRLPLEPAPGASPRDGIARASRGPARRLRRANEISQSPGLDELPPERRQPYAEDDREDRTPAEQSDEERIVHDASSRPRARSFSANLGGRSVRRSSSPARAKIGRTGMAP